jgi:hypothetical protein
MRAPTEVVIDRLVLSGVSEGQAPVILASFRRHMAHQLRHPTDRLPAATDEAERHGQLLADAVVRSIRRAELP